MNFHWVISRADSTRDTTSTRADSLTRALGVVALIGVAFTTVTCVLAQFLRTDLDWITVSMSIYVQGPYGRWVQASFFAPAPGIAALGIGWYRALDWRARSVFPLILFLVAAAALCITASFIADATRWPTTPHGTIHQWAAFGTFICVTAAALLQSLRLRFDPYWRAQFIEATTIASVNEVYFWVYALSPIPRGIGEKVVIALVLLWLWRASWWLVRAPPADHQPRRERCRFQRAPHTAGFPLRPGQFILAYSRTIRRRAAPECSKAPAIAARCIGVTTDDPIRRPRATARGAGATGSCGPMPTKAMASRCAVQRGNTRTANEPSNFISAPSAVALPTGAPCTRTRTAAAAWR